MKNLLIIAVVLLLSGFAVGSQPKGYPQTFGITIVTGPYAGDHFLGWYENEFAGDWRSYFTEPESTLEMVRVPYPPMEYGWQGGNFFGLIYTNEVFPENYFWGHFQNDSFIVDASGDGVSRYMVATFPEPSIGLILLSYVLLRRR